MATTRNLVRTVRVCLKCNTPFPSQGPGNRICGACRRINSQLTLTEDEFAKQRGVKRHNGEIIENAQPGS